MSLNNQCRFLGNLTRDPELKTVAVKGEDQSVCNFSIAVNSRKDADPEYVNLSVWGPRAEVVNKYFKKGSPILVEAEMYTDKWTDKTSGEEKKATKFRMTDFSFVGTGRKDGDEVTDETKPAASRSSKLKSKKSDDDVPF